MVPEAHSPKRQRHRTPKAFLDVGYEYAVCLPRGAHKSRSSVAHQTTSAHLL